MKTLEKALERSLEAGWRRLAAEGELSEVLAYGVISPEGMESLEPLVFTRADAKKLLRDWMSPELDPRQALAFPPAVHQGDRLAALFTDVAAAYAELEIDEQAALDNEARSIVETAVTRVFRRLIKRGVFGERSAAAGGPFLGFFGHEIGNEQLAAHLRELNPAAWVDKWIAGPVSAPPGHLVSCGKPAVEVSVNTMSLHAASGLIVQTGWSGLVRLWQLADLRKPLYSKTDLTHGVTAHALSAEGAALHLAWRGSAGAFGVQVMDLATRKRRELGVRLRGESWALATMPGRPWLLIGTDRGEVIVWDTREDRQVHRWHAHRGAIRALSVSSDGATLHSGSREGGLKAWDLETWTERFSLLALNVEHICPTPRRRELVTLACAMGDSSAGMILTFVDQASGAVTRTLRLEGAACGGASGLAVSPDESRLGVGVGFGEGNAHVRLLDYTSGQELFRVNAGHEVVTGLAFAPGSRRRLFFSGRHFRGAQLHDWTAPGEAV